MWWSGHRLRHQVIIPALSPDAHLLRCAAAVLHAQCTNTNSVCVSVVQVFPFTHLWPMHAKAPIGQLPAKPAGWGGKIWGLGGRQLGLGASKHKSKYNLPQACKSKYAGPHVVKYGSARAVHYMLTPPLKKYHLSTLLIRAKLRTTHLVDPSF